MRNYYHLQAQILWTQEKYFHISDASLWKKFDTFTHIKLCKCVSIYNLKNELLYIIGLFIRAKSKSNEIKVMLYHQNYPKDICLDNPSSSAMNHNSCVVFCVGGDKTYSSILKPTCLMFNGSFCLHMTFVGNVHCCYLFERLLLYILFIWHTTFPIQCHIFYSSNTATNDLKFNYCNVRFSSWLNLDELILMIIYPCVYPVKG